MGNTAREPVAGILGGMGPEATVELMRRVIAATPAKDDADHIHMIVDSNPKVPSRLKALLEGGGDDPAPVLASMARGLQQIGADYIIVPCNTAHHYLRPVQEAVTIPVFNVVDACLDRIALRKRRRAGLLASPALRRIGLFEAKAEARGLAIVHPTTEDEEVILGTIRAVKAAQVTTSIREDYLAAAARLAAGCDMLLVACTELSVLVDPRSYPVEAIDTLDIMVEEILARSLPRRMTPQA